MQEEKTDFPGSTYKDCSYKPMLELIQYLQENDFTVYIVSGSERGVVWGAASEVVMLPRSQMIGIRLILACGNTDGDSKIPHNTPGTPLSHRNYPLPPQIHG